MICIQLSGGLGNQMFQYACGRSLAYRHQTDLVFDMSRLHKNQGGTTVRQYGLDIFTIQGEEINEAGLRKSKPLIYRIFNTLSIKLRGKGIQTPVYFIETKYSDNTTIENTSGNCFLSGYWQSPRYFQTIDNLIRQEFIFPNKLNQENLDRLNEIKNTNSVSLHIRRTDYVNNAAYEVNGICALDYYEKAIDFISKKVVHPVFFIFSDDIEWAKSNLQIPYLCSFISGNNESNSYIDMQLMSFCKNNIIANSSFSWWGAWLNQNHNKIVIAPANWFVDKILNDQTGDLIPNSWITI